MRNSIAYVGLALVTGALWGCGSSNPAPPKDPTPKPADTATPASTGTGATSDAKPAPDKHDLAEQAEHIDPNEKSEPIDLAPLVAKGTPKSAFPKQTVGDHDCLKELQISGKHKVDYEFIVGKCGTPTGMLQFTKPAEGRLHAKLDQRDEFRLKVFKGMCYRYFAVGDDGIKDIDIIVLKKGALLATDKTEQHIAVIDTDKLWCVDEDMDLDFKVEVDGKGAGGYTFGVWTRPNK